ncbi:MAG: ChrR family anti-sigma-E factor, partial [Cellvibrio sp.]
MIKHHPDDNLLTEYASGGIATAVGMIICAHLQACPHCRQRVEQLNKLGAAILNQSAAEPVQQETFEHLMARIRNQPAPAKEELSSKSGEVPAVYINDPMMKRLPKVITKLLPRDGKIKWQAAGGSLKTARLQTGQRDYEVSFQRISSGGKVFEHGHRGLEVTLVLHGSFSDEDGIYSEGDFLVRTPGE